MAKAKRAGRGAKARTDGAKRRRPTAKAAAKAVKTVKAAKKPARKPTRGDGAGAGGDEYGARGGMPFIQLGRDRSAVRSATTELTWSEFDRQAQALARALARSFKPEAVVGIVHGGVFVGGAIANALNTDFHAVRIARRSRDTGHQHHTITEEMPKGLAGRRVLLVDDVAASGDSLELGRRLAKAAGATKVATAALVSRTNGYAPDFTGWTTDTFVVFPWDYEPVSGDARFEPEDHHG